MNNSRKKKGFTLAELLIVVAIIAVLVAISIPIFTSQLEKIREATDAANIRSAYAEIQSAALTESDPAGESTKDITLSRTGDQGSYVYKAEVVLVQKQEGWQNTSITDIGGMNPGSPTAGQKAVVTYTESTGKTELSYEK